MSGVLRRVVLAVAVVVATGGCSETLVARGELAEEPETSSASSPSATPTGRSTPSPPPSRPRNPAAVARVVDVRASDLPAGWSQVPSGSTGKDNLSWAVVCARDVGVSPGTLSGAETPEFSPTGTANSSQIGTATGLFPDDAAAKRYVNLFRSPTMGRCMAEEAVRTWPDSFSGGVPAFAVGSMRVRTATEAAGLGTTATLRDGRHVTIQFIAIRTGPIVTMLNTIWIGDSDSRLLSWVATRIGSRQRTV